MLKAFEFMSQLCVTFSEGAPRSGESILLLADHMKSEGPESQANFFLVQFHVLIAEWNQLYLWFQEYQPLEENQ